jgi:hypothetical protein
MIKKDSNQTNSAKNLSRRQFAKVAAIGIAAAAPVIIASAQTTAPTPPKEPAAPPNPQASPTPAAVSPVAVAFAAVAEARFGSQLTPEQLSRVKEDLQGNVRTAERLRAVKLQNADEPDFVFAA